MDPFTICICFVITHSGQHKHVHQAPIQRDHALSPSFLPHGDTDQAGAIVLPRFSFRLYDDDNPNDADDSDGTGSLVRAEEVQGDYAELSLQGEDERRDSDHEDDSEGWWGWGRLDTSEEDQAVRGVSGGCRYQVGRMSPRR
jgi:hypothetical protein